MVGTQPVHLWSGKYAGRAGALGDCVARKHQKRRDDDRDPQCAHRARAVHCRSTARATAAVVLVNTSKYMCTHRTLRQVNQYPS